MTVVDPSGVLAILLREADGRAVFRAIESSESLLAPALLPYEVLSGLQAAERQKRIDGATATRCIQRLGAMPWAFDVHGTDARLGELARLSRAHGLSPYDSAYLELALRHRCPLVSLDASLRKAARTEHVDLLPRQAGA